MVALKQRLETAERTYETLRAVGMLSNLDPIYRRDIAIMRFIYTFEAGCCRAGPVSCGRADWPVPALSRPWPASGF